MNAGCGDGNFPRHCEAAVQAELGRFLNTVPSQQAKKGRCRCPARVADSAVAKLQEGLVPLMREGVSFLKGSVSHPLAQGHGLAFFGYTGSMVYCGPEYNSMGTFRFAERGERELIALHFTTFWSAVSAERQNHKLSAEYNLTHFFQDVLLKLDAADDLFKTLAMNDQLKIWKGHIPANALLYIPAGMLLVERTLNNNLVAGLSIQVFDKTSAAQNNLAEMLRIHERDVGSTSKLGDIWKSVMCGATNTSPTHPKPEA